MYNSVDSMENLINVNQGFLAIVSVLILLFFLIYTILHLRKTNLRELNLRLHESRLAIFNEYSKSVDTLIKNNNMHIILYGEPQDIFHAVEKVMNQGLTLSLSYNSARLFFQKDAQLLAYLKNLLEEYDKISKQLIELLSSYHLTHKQLIDKIKIYYPKIDFAEIEEKINQQYVIKKSQQDEDLEKMTEEIKEYQNKIQDPQFSKLFENYLMPKRF